MSSAKNSFALIISVGIAVLLYALTPGSPSAGSDTAAEFRFLWIYVEVLFDETVVLLALLAIVLPAFTGQAQSLLSHKARLAWPVKVGAAVALVGGTFLFGFWATVDTLGGYTGPGYAISSYPILAEIRAGLGLARLYRWDRMGVEGFIGFCFAIAGFVTLRLGRGLGTALREGITHFAAPILLVSEFALWNSAPADMYWHVTSFTPWSLGVYLTQDQFSELAQAPSVVWAGNVYLVSNWLVLIVSFVLVVMAILHIGEPGAGDRFEEIPKVIDLIRTENKSALRCAREGEFPPARESGTLAERLRHVRT